MADVTMRQLIESMDGQEVEVRTASITIKGTLTHLGGYVILVSPYKVGTTFYIPVDSIDCIMTST